MKSTTMVRMEMMTRQRKKMGGYCISAAINLFQIYHKLRDEIDHKTSFMMREILLCFRKETQQEKNCKQINPFKKVDLIN